MMATVYSGMHNHTRFRPVLDSWEIVIESGFLKSVEGNACELTSSGETPDDLFIPESTLFDTECDTMVYEDVATLDANAQAWARLVHASPSSAGSAVGVEGAGPAPMGPEKTAG